MRTAVAQWRSPFVKQETYLDAVAELREAADFLHYYAVEAGSRPKSATPLDVVGSIAPWNFLLAIFIGQNVWCAGWR